MCSLWYFVACMPEELTMKKDVAASAAEAVAPKKPEFSLIDEDLLKSRIYTIRGVKVMLDADLAEIYGYSTKDFNRQVKNNIKKFDLERLSSSAFVNWNRKSSSNFSILFLTCLLKSFVLYP